MRIRYLRLLDLCQPCTVTHVYLPRVTVAAPLVLDKPVEYIGVNRPHLVIGRFDSVLVAHHLRHVANRLSNVGIRVDNNHACIVAITILCQPM